MVKLLDYQYLRANGPIAGQLAIAGTSNNVSFTNCLTVDSNGNIGIGTSINRNINIVGNTSVSGNLAINSGSLIFPDGSTQTTAAASSIPGGPVGAVQFNGSGSFSGTNNLYWDNSNIRLGIGVDAPFTTLQIKDWAIESTSNQFNGENIQVLDSFSVPTIRSAHYFVQISDNDNSWYHTSQIMVVQDGLNAYLNEYNVVTSVNPLGVFNVQVVTGIVQFTFQAFQNTNKTVKVARTSLTI